MTFDCKKKACILCFPINWSFCSFQLTAVVNWFPGRNICGLLLFFVCNYLKASLSNSIMYTRFRLLLSFSKRMNGILCSFSINYTLLFCARKQACETIYTRKCLETIIIDCWSQKWTSRGATPPPLRPADGRCITRFITVSPPPEETMFSFKT